MMSAFFGQKLGVICERSLSENLSIIIKYCCSIIIIIIVSFLQIKIVGYQVLNHTV